MSDSVRERIIKALFEKASTLTSREVERCRRGDPVRGDLFISLWDGASRSQGIEHGCDVRVMPIGIEAIWLADTVSKETTESEEANEVMALIERRFFEEDPTLGGLVSRFTWQSSTPNYSDDGNKVVAVRVEFEVEFKTKFGNPYLIDSYQE